MRTLNILQIVCCIIVIISSIGHYIFRFLQHYEYDKMSSHQFHNVRINNNNNNKVIAMTIDEATTQRHNKHRKLFLGPLGKYFLLTKVCRKVGEVYVTEMQIGFIWWLLRLLNIWSGVSGSCEDVCPCNENEECISISGSDNNSNDHQCRCMDDYVYNGTSCVSNFCGGFAGFPCPNGYNCVDDPRDTCDPKTGGADCAGICQVAPKFCGGIAAIPCDDGYTCIDDPDDGCDPTNGGADCGGICVKDFMAPSCTLDGNECETGYTCTDNPDSSCKMSVNPSCSGICALVCGGFTITPVFCPDGFVCLDNPLTCSQAVDCPGVCIENRKGYQAGGKE